MKNSGKLVSFLVPIISILLAFVIGCIIMAVLAFNFIGDGLRDALDPKMRQ